MRIQKLLSGTFFAGLFTASLLFTPAMAGETLPQPQGKWALTKIDRVATSGNSYCTLSHGYADNIVLSLGRNLAEEYSLALDFQKPVFEKDKSLKISLQPGPGQTRAYDLMPASERALVIRLGWDSAFFKTLDQSGSMRISIADKSYAFKLPDIAKGQSDLKDCMEELKLEAAKTNPSQNVATKDVLLADAGASNASGFTAEKSEEAAPAKSFAKVAKTAEKEAEKMAVVASAPVVKAAQETQQKVQQVPAPKMQPAAIDKVNPALAAQNERLEKDLQKALAQSKALEEQLGSVQKSMADTKPLQDKIAKLETDIAAKEAAVATTSADLEKAKAAMAGAATQSAESAALKKQNDELQQKLAAMEKGTIDAKSLQEKVVSLENDLAAKEAALKTVSDSATKGQSSTQELMAQKTAELEAAKTEKERLSAKLAEMEKAGVDTNAQAAKIADLEAKLKSKEDDLAQKTLAANSDKTAQDILAQKTAEIEASKIEGKALKDKIAALESQLATQKTAAATTPVTPLPGSDMEIKKANEKAATFEAKVKELEAKNAQLEDTVRQSQTRIAETAVNTETKSVKTIVDLQSKLEAAQKDNIALAKQLDSVKLQQEDKRLNLIAGDWDLEKATKRFNESEREVQRLGLQLEKERTSCNMEKEKIEGMLFDPAVTEQKQIEKLTQLEKELQEAKAANPSFVGAQELASLKSTVENLQTENADLRAKAGTLSAQLVDTQSNGGARVDQVASTQIEMQELRQQLALKDKQNATYLNQLATLQQQQNMAAKTAANMQLQKIASIKPAAGAPDEVKSMKAAAPASSQSDVSSLLKQAGLSPAGFKKLGSSGEVEKFSWKDAQNLNGSASVQPMKGKGFDALVTSYIGQQKSACNGDFASMPSPSAGSAAKQMSLYEVACVEGGQSSSASLLFYENKGDFVAISNATDAANMDMAMDSRDRIAQAIRGM